MIVNAFRLPDLFSLSSSFTPGFNPHYARAVTECRAWLVSRNVLGAQTEVILVNGDMERLCAYSYPNAPYEQFRAISEFVCLLIVVDEVCDEKNDADAFKTGQSFLNALRDPMCDDDSALAQATREFREHMCSWLATDGWNRFVRVCESYIACVVEEASLRERGEVLSVKAYESVRRENSAVRPCAALMEFALGISLPDHVFANEHFMTVYWTMVDMVCWANDIYSYAVEYQKGLDGNNVLTVLMSDKSLELQAASDYAGEHYKTLVRRHWAAREALAQQTFGSPEVDAQVALVVEEMANWAIGNAVWSFETRRYLGDDGPQVKESLRVVLKTRCSDEKRMPA
ncbi:terpenoid synthase [Exidia glandulosa HHB12029]|uniref:Terpene synthase n=1 Tax=Exidia glandulosa HHB12029 TaxID=1314781 RepID=A0A165J8C3_EXIGL|nr:terpenoid synthase [Exidia glandulosa HHB12029]